MLVLLKSGRQNNELLHGLNNIVCSSQQCLNLDRFPFFLSHPIGEGKIFGCGRKFCPASVRKALHTRGAASLTQKNIGIHYQNTFCGKESGRAHLKDFYFFPYKKTCRCEDACGLAGCGQPSRKLRRIRLTLPLSLLA